MNTVTVTSAGSWLVVAVEDVWNAVGELVLIAVEDQPDDDSLAAVDAFAEQVVELQGELACAREALTEETTAAGLPAVHAAVNAASWRYWSRLRTYGVVSQLRAATRRLGGAWPAWLRSVELSAARCEDPLMAAAAALHERCNEVCQAAVALTSLPPDPFRRTS